MQDDHACQLASPLEIIATEIRNKGGDLINIEKRDRDSPVSRETDSHSQTRGKRIMGDCVKDTLPPLHRRGKQTCFCLDEARISCCDLKVVQNHGCRGRCSVDSSAQLCAGRSGHAGIRALAKNLPKG
jgi:hypothetical protein